MSEQFANWIFKSINTYYIISSKSMLVMLVLLMFHVRSHLLKEKRSSTLVLRVNNSIRQVSNYIHRFALKVDGVLNLTEINLILNHLHCITSKLINRVSFFRMLYIVIKITSRFLKISWGISIFVWGWNWHVRGWWFDPYSFDFLRESYLHLGTHHRPWGETWHR